MHDPISDEWHVWPDADSEGNMKNLYLHICFSTGALHEGPCLSHNVADQVLAHLCRLPVASLREKKSTNVTRFHLFIRFFIVSARTYGNTIKAVLKACY